MVQIIRFLSVISLAAAGLTHTAVFKRDIATIETDIAGIATQATALDNAVEAFPPSGGSLTSALLIHTDITNLIKAINTATSDVQATGPLTEEDCHSILQALETVVSILVQTLKDLVAKKPAFGAQPFSGLIALILDDIQSLKNAIIAFINALIDECPADLGAEASELQDELTDAFDSAVDAYSS